MTTTTTTTTTEPTEPVASFYVSAEHEGFAFEPDEAIGFALVDLLTCEADAFDRALGFARALAAADEASSLSRPKRAEFASAVMVDHPTREGFVLQLSASTYSKRVRAGRATDDQVLEFLLACDAPTLDKLYEWLPKASGVGRPKGAKTAKATPEPVSVPETPVDVKATRWDDAHIATASTALIGALRAQGADDVSIRLVVADAMRKLSPVRSVA